MRSFAAKAALFALTALVVSGPAFAQRAPITFAGRGQDAVVEQGAPVQLASVEPGLAGGDDNSYGYGGQRQRSGQVLDLRRAPGSSPREQVEEPQPQAQQASAEEGRPAWLEQERVGPPYQAGGQWYVPTPEPGYEATGTASWYGPQFHGQATASGEAFDQEALTAAHPTLPIPSLVQVTNLENGREIIVRVNDRGPFVGGRLIDLSRRSAEVLGFEGQGHANVHIRYLGPAPRHYAGDGALAQNAMQAPAPVAASYAPVQAAGPMQLLPSDNAVAASDDAAADQGAALYAQQQAPAPRAPSAGEGSYFVQVGAFGDLSNAHRVRAQVEAAGPVVVDTRSTAAGELFRVRVGPFANAQDASAARAALADMGYNQTIVASR